MTLRQQLGRSGRRPAVEGQAATGVPGRAGMVVDLRDGQSPRIVIDHGYENASLPIITGREPEVAVTDQPKRVWEGWPLRSGVRPLLLALDILAWACGLATSGAFHPSLLVFGVLLIGFYALGGLYNSRLAPSLLDDLPQLTGRLLIAVALSMTALVVLNKIRWHDNIVNWQLLTAAAVTGFLGFGLRGAAYVLVRHARASGRIRHRTLILGAGRVGTYLADTLTAHPVYGLEPIGFLDVERPAHSSTAPSASSLKVLGRPDELVEVLLDHDVRNVVVAWGSIRESEMVDIIRTCDRLHCEIFVVPRLFELHHVNGDMDTAWGMPLTRLRRATYRSWMWRVKRAIDVTVSGGALLALSPLMGLIALAVRLEGGPGILFRQERVGVDGRQFKLLKFRSMKPVDETEADTNWNIAQDDRLGRVGRFIRRASLDELPQLINILRGDMSLVGPRPERPHFVSEFRQQHPHYVARHRVPSGLTGLAQVNGLRGDTSIAERARFDNYYIENWSLWLDVKIVLRTALSVLRQEGG